MRRVSFITLTIAGLCLFAACTARKGVAASRSEDPRGATQIPAGTEADDAARFLAGLPGRDASPFKAMESTPAWEQHRKELDELWQPFDQGRKPGMLKFAKSELKGTSVDGRVVWYPFSGADALTMLTFFPDHSTYVMAALEPPGLVPTAREFESDQLGDRLPAISGTLQSLIQKSFFVTKEMDHQLRGQVVDGVAEPILILLARSGYRILGHSYIQLDDSGHVQPRIPGPRRAAFGLNRGISFNIESPAGKRSTLTYVSLNLDDNHMKGNHGFPAYIASLGPTVTMLKATSYMLHSPSFGRIRDLILERSGLIVQDDSGIPWRYLASDPWQVQLYGDYDHPYGKSFQFRSQADLREAYEAQRQAVRPLEFRIGYGAGKVTSNLQVARRKS